MGLECEERHGFGGGGAGHVERQLDAEVTCSLQLKLLLHLCWIKKKGKQKSGKGGNKEGNQESASNVVAED